ncbi:hypothetical protein SAMN05421548_11366 [Paraburkholderia lycopersici]|uniref:Uncharacterized protein n=1 Tax=Paraburkholderia lycopersici TaxID=416944 RepID=A0A1G6RCS0_9BURK|nr:hypothetical protein SAMN05421548_11366 [Paraburkholderia lycopersici]
MGAEARKQIGPGWWAHGSGLSGTLLQPGRVRPRLGRALAARGPQAAHDTWPVGDRFPMNQLSGYDPNLTS